MTDLKQLTILLVEDEPEERRETAAFLELYCGRVLQAPNGAEALVLIQVECPDLVISDIRMPVMGGLELAAQMKKCASDTPVIFLTAFTETANLLKAIELEVAGFINKPVDADILLARIAKAALPIIQHREIGKMSAELVASLQREMGNSPVLKVLMEETARVARTSFNVLLEGETGSGKSRLASIIHNISPRRGKPFVTIPLASIPVHLAESELFGHVRGAFTGAELTKTGQVENSHGGTLFLDDIDACPPQLQGKLLRFVEEKKFIPLGSSIERGIDARIISASNSSLRAEIVGGRFREDLYYRLADVTITLPPLRTIPDAVGSLALKFLRETCDELGRDYISLDDGAVKLLLAMPWPGNIRQLKSVIRRMALSAGSMIGAQDVASLEDFAAAVAPSTDGNVTCPPPPFPCSQDRLERWYLEAALNYCGGKRMKTAVMLGLNYDTFRRRLEKHGIVVDEK